MTGTCSRCGRDRTLARRDLCRSCYLTLWRNHTLPPAPPIPEQPVDCPHAGKHQHGTSTMYDIDRCRCAPCRAANSRRKKNGIASAQAGRKAMVDASRVRAHVKRLRVAGMSRPQIAALAGVSATTVTSIVNGHRQVITRPVAARLLTIEASDPVTRVLVDPTGTQRRLQGLVRAGYSLSSLGAQLGWTTSNVSRVATTQTHVFASTRAAVAHLCDVLATVPPPAQTVAQRGAVTRAQRYAQARHWAPLTAWDDDTIDDPDAKPAIDSQRRLSIREQVLELLEIGVSVTEIPARVGKPNLSRVMSGVRDPELRAVLLRRGIAAGLIDPSTVAAARRRSAAA